MSDLTSLYSAIVADLEQAGAVSPYPADANEPDPRYLSYGVRAPQLKVIIQTHQAALRKLSKAQKRQLAHQLIESGYGEQQSVALHILKPLTAYFEPDKFAELDHIIRALRGWSKVDAYTGNLLPKILLSYPEELLPLVQTWNQDANMWLRRTSVVLFTRNIAKSRQFTDVALSLGEQLLFDSEDLVQKGVGWMLKDLMKVEKARILPYVQDLRRRNVSSTITLYAIRDLKGAERKSVLAH